MKKHMKKNEEMAIKTASMILKKKFPVEEVRLFGSKARGDDDEESDIDLMVLTSRLISWEERKAVIDTLFDIELEYDVVLSPMIATTVQWKNGTFRLMPTYDEIENEGIVV